MTSSQGYFVAFGVLIGQPYNRVYQENYVHPLA